MTKLVFTQPADESRSGTFYGHAVGGVCMILFGLLSLLVMLYRRHDLPRGKTYCEVHVPERDLSLLSMLGKAMLLLSAFGMFLEVPDNDGHIPLIFHVELYFSFFVTACTTLLESKRLVPPDSFRCAFAVALILQGHSIWYHGDNYSEVDLRTHLVWSKNTLAAGVVMLYSIMKPTSTFAYLGCNGIVILNGTWMISIAFFTAGMDLAPKLIETWVAVQGSFITLAIVLVSALFMPPCLDEDEKLGKSTEYDALNLKAINADDL